MIMRELSRCLNAPARLLRSRGADGRIVAWVVDALTGKAIPDAAILVVGSGISTDSGHDGAFTLVRPPGLDAGALHVAAEGYERARLACDALDDPAGGRLALVSCVLRLQEGVGGHRSSSREFDTGHQPVDAAPEQEFQPAVCGRSGRHEDARGHRARQRQGQPNLGEADGAAHEEKEHQSPV
jgi:hypothetical protein